ncbi:MAG TPA: HAMP domain-containing sensor histidine kinase [Polyangia bacterium]|jgi:signal transduction histidine kinase|nr:HAMP domain-containing sensor histidine kinase [Polyangia bacterium]
MSSARTPDGKTAAAGAWRTLGARVAAWYVAVSLVSYVTLALILPLLVKTWVDGEAQHATETALDRYKDALEAGGTDALKAMFDCHAGAGASVALRVSDRQNVDVYRGSSDVVSGRVAATLRDRDTGRLAPERAPPGWHVASVSTSQGRTLELVLHDDGSRRAWDAARSTSALILGCGLVCAVLGALLITRRALRPLGDLARTTRRIIDSGDLGLRVPTRGTTDSLDRLGALFNAMLARNEAQARAMKESLDNVAHDLRTPLTRLRAGAELALHGEADGPRTREALAEAIEESDRVLAMLTALMDIAEAAAGAMRLDTRDEDLSDIAREAVDLYDLVSADRGVHVVTRLEPGVIASVDRARVRQVAANLIDNALKYTAPGGRVEVSVRREGEASVLTVVDTGMGIAAPDIPRVWDRLYRADRSRTERGLGLGLSLVKAIVEAHGGDVSVRSEVGVGSTFEVRFPRAPARSQSGAAQSESSEG